MCGPRVAYEYKRVPVPYTLLCICVVFGFIVLFDRVGPAMIVWLSGGALECLSARVRVAAMCVCTLICRMPNSVVRLCTGSPTSRRCPLER